MKGTGFITFPFGNKILITGDDNKAIVSLNTETKVVEETDLEPLQEDYFNHFHNGMRVNDSIYLVGNSDLHIVSMTSNQTRIIRGKGINSA